MSLCPQQPQIPVLSWKKWNLLSDIVTHESDALCILRLSVGLFWPVILLSTLSSKRDFDSQTSC